MDSGGKRVADNANDIVSDPAKRKPIKEYESAIRDKVRRKYVQKGPCKPTSHTFPPTIVGDTERSFQAKWLKEWDWLEYSITQEAAFCFWCYLYGDKSEGDQTFRKKGFRDWKKAIAKFKDHVGLEGSIHNTARTLYNLAMDINILCADAIAKDPDAIEKLATLADRREDDDHTLLHIACMDRNTELVKFILEAFANKNLLVKVNKYKQTPLHLAAYRGYSDVVDILIKAARLNADDPSKSPSTVEDYVRQKNFVGNTALHEAVNSGDVATVERLVNADRNDRHTKNKDGHTPTSAAVALGNYDILEMICKTCTAPSLDGALYLAIREFHKGSAHKDIVRVLLESHQDAAKLILKDLPYERVTEIKSGLKGLITMAFKKEWMDIVKILFEIYEAGKTAHAGHVFLIEAIEEGDKELFYALLEYDKHLAAYETAESPWTALHYAAYHQSDQIIEDIINVQRALGYSLTNKDPPLFLAVQKGFISTAIILMNLMPDTSSIYTKRGSRRNILHIAVLENNKEMIQTILEHCPRSLIDKILNGQDENGNTPLHLLIDQGCFVPELIKHSSVNMMTRNKDNQTPSDMLHSHEEVKADQGKIKYLLDDALGTRQSWRINIKGRWSNTKKPGDTTKRVLKDLKFKASMNHIKEEELQEWKEKIKPYRERTTTQIIVTALITTVTFTVGFTMPGGYHQSGEPEEGLVLLSKKKAFEVFMVTDALALALSITSLFIYFISSVYDDPRQVSKFDVASIVLNIVSVIAMILTFIAGVYVVLSHSPGLALIVCIICSIFLLSLVVLLIKMMYDCKRSRKINV